MGFPNFLSRLRQQQLFNPQAMQQGPQLPPVDLAGGPIPPNIAPMQPQFGPTDLPNPGPGGMPEPEPTPYDAVARMHELYSPENTASDQYNQLNQAYPQFQQPSTKRRIGAAALGAITDLGTNLGGTRTGIKGREVFEDVTGRNKYQEAVEDWKNRIGPAGTAANLERQSNINERQMANQVISQEQTTRRLEETERKNKEAEKVRQQRANAYDWKTHHPSWKFEQGKDGNLRAYDPQNPQNSMSLGKTGMDQAELAMLNLQNDIRKIDATQAGRERIVNTTEAGKDRRFNQAMDVYMDADGNPIYIPKSSAGGPATPVLDKSGESPGPIDKPGTTPAESETQLIARRKRIGQQIYDQHPELRGYLAYKNGMYVPKKPSAMFAKGKEEEAKALETIRQLLEEGESNQAPTPSKSSGATGGRGGGPGNPQPRYTPDSPPPVPNGYDPKYWKMVRKPGGGWTAVER